MKKKEFGVNCLFLFCGAKCRHTWKADTPLSYIPSFYFIFFVINIFYFHSKFLKTTLSSPAIQKKKISQIWPLDSNFPDHSTKRINI